MPVLGKLIKKGAKALAKKLGKKKPLRGPADSMKNLSAADKKIVDNYMKGENKYRKGLYKKFNSKKLKSLKDSGSVTSGSKRKLKFGKMDAAVWGGAAGYAGGVGVEKYSKNKKLKSAKNKMKKMKMKKRK